jgi:MATE family multidrug resistance protein
MSTVLPIVPPVASVPAPRELGALLNLAAPLVVASLAQMAMGVVGTVMAGQLGVGALAAQGLATTVFVFALVSSYGLMNGLDPHIARAVGAGNHARAGQLFRQSLWMAVFGAVPMTAALLASPWLLRTMGQAPALVDVVETYLWWSAAGLLPAMWFGAWRSYSSAAGRPRVVMVAAIVANVFNIGLCQWFIWGGWGVPAMGVHGIALASVFSRVLMVAMVAGYCRTHPVFAPFRRAPDRLGWRGHWQGPVAADLGQILRSGLPLALQYSLEVAGFVLVTLWMGLLGDAVLAAHEVAMSVAAVAFQVPSALGTAAAMRVGHAIGRRDEAGIGRAGWTALAVGIGYAVTSAAVMLIFRHQLAALYIKGAEPAVLGLAAMLVAIAGAFQLGDGCQAIGFGVLRGLDDTRVPVLFNVLGYGLIGLPFGWYAVFRLGWGPQTLWWGLTAALCTVAISLALRFRVLLRHRLRALQRSGVPTI